MESTSAGTPATQSSSTHLGVLIGSDLKERFYQAGLEAAGQRRNVTVLFADLCDYTGLSAKLDDEALYEIIQSYIGMLTEMVYQHEGMVDKITGDGLMALFGAPIALENPAERAVRAALEMQAGLDLLNQQLKEQLGEKLQMHIGLNRGSVIVGGIGSDLLVDYTAIGDSVNLARRLQEAASEDTVLVSETVYRTTRSLFDYQKTPGLRLKGYPAGIDAFRVVGIKSAPERVRGLQGLHAPMVGRESELKQVINAMDAMLSNQQGRLVTLVGEAGIGKSRLTAEFKSSLDLRQVTLLEGQSLTYRKSVSYWILLEVLRDYLGITLGTGKKDIQEKLRSKVSELLGTESASLLPFLEKLFNLDPSDASASQKLDYLDAEQLRQQNFIAIRNFLLAIAERKPLILVLEDLHWADEISLEFLSYFLEAIGNAPVMMLAISRPSPEGNIDQFLMNSQRHLGGGSAIIHLESLSAEQSDQLLFGLLGALAIPEDVRTQIVQRAAGVPFYIEETLRMLIDRSMLVEHGDGWKLVEGVNLKDEVPENLQDLILTRFDRLSPLQRKILQTASVIGRQFNKQLLEMVLNFTDHVSLGEALETLVQKAFIQAVTGQGYESYLFRHVLTSDAVYHTLLRADRNRLHGLVANSIEQVYADQIESQVEVLAGHYMRSEFLEKALHYLILAGRKSAREYANAQAQSYFEEARQLLAEVDHTAEQAKHVWLGLGDVLVFIGEYEAARSCYLELKVDWAEGNGNNPGSEQHLVYRKVATTYERQGEFDLALEQLDIASTMLEQADEAYPVAEAQILNDRGWIQFLRGNFQEARISLKDALDMVSGSDELGVIASINNRLGAVSYQLREYGQAARYVRKSLELRRSLGDLSGEARLYNNLGLLGLMSGDLKDAESNFYQSISLLEKVGDTEGIALANINLGLVKFDLGDYESAQVHLEKAVLVSDSIGHRFYLGLADMYLGRLESALGGYQRADDLLAESQEIFEELGAMDNLVDAQCYRADNFLTWGDIPGAVRWCNVARENLAQEGSELAGDSVQSGRVLRLQGSLARIQGELDLSAQYLEESAEIFRLAEEKLESARTGFELGLLAEEQGQLEEAEEYFEQARTVFIKVGARKEAQRVASHLQTSPV